MMMMFCGVLYVCMYELIICCKSLCVLVLVVLFCRSCFALLVVVSMMTMEFERSRVWISFSVRCSVNVMCLVMLYFCCLLLLLLLLLIVLSAASISAVVVCLWLLSWKKCMFCMLSF